MYEHSVKFDEPTVEVLGYIGAFASKNGVCNPNWFGCVIVFGNFLHDAVCRLRSCGAYYNSSVASGGDDTNTC